MGLVLVIGQIHRLPVTQTGVGMARSGRYAILSHSGATAGNSYWGCTRRSVRYSSTALILTSCEIVSEMSHGDDSGSWVKLTGEVYLLSAPGLSRWPGQQRHRVRCCRRLPGALDHDVVLGFLDGRRPGVGSTLPILRPSRRKLHAAPALGLVHIMDYADIGITRPNALGRKNDLFMGSASGGRAAAIAYT